MVISLTIDPKAKSISPVVIGDLVLNSRVFLSPMAGVCDRPFKRLVRLYDQEALLSTELVNGEAWLRGDREMERRIGLGPSETPVALQLSGHHPEFLARAAAKAQEMGADLLDLNLGCPTPHIVNNGNGAALLRDPNILPPLFSAIREAVSIPFTIKIRLGWDDDNLTGAQIAHMAQECGVDAIWIHGRTKVQGYKGESDWAQIDDIASNLSIPVIGNGDITTPEMGVARLNQTRVKAIAIGRGAMGNPWIFKQTEHLYQTDELLPKPTLKQHIEAAKMMLLFLCEDICPEDWKPGDDHPSEVHATREMRKHLNWFLKGFPQAKEAVKNLNQQNNYNSVIHTLDNYLADLDDDLVSDQNLWGKLVDPKWQRYSLV
jgi:tRNA-dihydrouridine synthase B